MHPKTKGLLLILTLLRLTSLTALVLIVLSGLRLLRSRSAVGLRPRGFFPRLTLARSSFSTGFTTAFTLLEIQELLALPHPKAKRQTAEQGPGRIFTSSEEARLHLRYSWAGRQEC